MPTPTVVTRTARGAPVDAIECEYLDIMGFELAVHKYKGKWQVTEPDTGFKFAGPADTREAAIKLAEDRVKEYGRDKVQAAINKGLEMQK